MEHVSQKVEKNEILDDLLGLVNFEPIGSGQSACQNRTNLHFSKIFQIK